MDLLKNKGVQRLLDAVVDFLPSPVDIGEVKGANLETQILNYQDYRTLMNPLVLSLLRL